MNIKKRKKPAVIVFYVMAVIMGIYTIFTTYTSIAYIASMVSTQGLKVTDELSSVLGYIAAASIPSIFYTIVTFGMGYIIDKLDKISNKEEIINEVDIVNGNEEVDAIDENNEVEEDETTVSITKNDDEVDDNKER